MSNSIRHATALLTIAMLLLAACDTSEEHDGRYSSLFRLVPDQPAFRDGVTIVDYGAIRALPGYEEPQSSAPSDGGLAPDLRALPAALELNGVAVPFREILGTGWDSLPPNLANWEQGFGFGLPDVDLALTAGVIPPRTLHAIGDEFDPAAIETQLRDCTVCVEGEQRDHRGRRYFTWGDGQILPERLSPPAFDDLGRGGSFVFDSNYVLRSNFLEDFEASIDASQGRSSLLGDDDFALLAEELDSFDLLALFMSSRTPGPGYAQQLLQDFSGNPAVGEAVTAAWDVPSDEKLAPYEAFAVGAGVSDREQFTLVLLVHESSEAATANVERLQNRIETGVTVRDGQPWTQSINFAEVTTQDRLLVAILRGSSYYAGLANNPALGSITVEALLAHE